MRTRLLLPVLTLVLLLILIFVLRSRGGNLNVTPEAREEIEKARSR